MRLSIILALAGALLLAGTAGANDTKSGGSFASPNRFVQDDGEALYRSICQGCHMPDGKGAQGAGAYPALAANPNLEAGAYPVTLVVNGNRAMPGFGGVLDDAQVAAVVNYVRTHFGNRYEDPVQPAEVHDARPAKH